MGAAQDIEFLVSAAEEFATQTVEQLVDLVLEGERSPFAADLTPSQKMAYYTAQFFNPDGSPNEIGRQQELQRLGLADYVKTLGQIQKLRGLYQPAPLETGVE